MRNFRNFNRLLLLTVAVLLLLGGKAQAHPKTDVVILNNGDRITCEIKKLQRGKLTVKTDAMGTLEIEWDKVQSVTSNYAYQVELQSGRLFVGSVQHLPEEERLVVARAVGSTALEYQRVVRMTPIEETIWQRVSGSIDLGYGYTQDQSATQWSLNTDATYTGQRYVASADFSSTFKTQENADDVNRQDVLMTLTRILENRWIAIGLGQFQTSSAEGLDLRALAGAGIGRYLLRSNRMTLSLLSGLDFNREKYASEDSFQSNAEAFGATRFEFFRFNYPEMDASSIFIVFPSLTTSGRVRMTLNAKVRFEILKDFYWSLSYFQNYDTNPPTDDFVKNDYGLNTAVGWSF